MTFPRTVEIIATVFSGFAILHTFACSRIHRWARSLHTEIALRKPFLLLSEAELVFGFWALVLLIAVGILSGIGSVIDFGKSLDFTDPLFVFVIMVIAATRPILRLSTQGIYLLAGLLPLKRESSVYSLSLILGPLLGSFITEPAAMTVTALILRDRYFAEARSMRFKYLTLAVLFVNVSIGGVLTPYAAPPVLMVAGKWQWDMAYMLGHFGWKAVLAILLNTFLVVWILRRELGHIRSSSVPASWKQGPLWLTLIHLTFLVTTVIYAHQASFFLPAFLAFVIVASLTRKHQDPLQLKNSSRVAFFLSGLIVLGAFQNWWLTPLIENLNALGLFLGSTVLTAFIDNAALTFLGAQIPDISESLKLALVSGAIAGGGLTVIANAPNPAGYAILQDRFKPDGISAVLLFAAALLPTLIAMICLWFLPNWLA